MKNVRQLVDYIFSSSQEHERALEEGDRKFLAELNVIEPVKVVDQGPLTAALKKAGLDGISGKVKEDGHGFYVEFDNSADYANLVKELIDRGKMYDLAAYGWIATYSDDTVSLGDTSQFRVNFLSIGEVEPGKTKGSESEGGDKTAMDREAVASYKAVNDLTGRKDSLRPADSEKVAESRAILDSLNNAADIVARLLSK